MHKISTRVVYVKGKQPSTPYHPTPHLHALRELTRKLPKDKSKRQEGGGKVISYSSWVHTV